MKDWQFNVLFIVAVGGAIVMLFSDKLGLSIRPEAITVFGTILAYVLTQHKPKKDDKDREKDKEDVDNG